ncbi:MAG TPA: hypothetical protein VMB03_20480 [Bryobacteraceae bacterium]|nr:hypothetical protein [Bryobacteraceae bacterium]
MFLQFLVPGCLVYFLYSNRGVLVMKLYRSRLRVGDYDGALARLHQIGFLLPSPAKHFCRALALALAGRSAEAERWLRESLRWPERRPGVPRERRLCLLAHELTELGRYAEAEECFHQAINSGDITGNSQSGLSELRLVQGRTDEALTLSRQAIEIAKRRTSERVAPVYYATQAQILALLGRGEDAQESLALALPGLQSEELMASRSGIGWRAGLALVALGRNAEGYEQFRGGHQADPGGKYGRRCREELDKAGVEAALLAPPPAMRPRMFRGCPSGAKKTTAIGA